MDKKRVILIASNTTDHDHRRPKEIEAIERRGYAVTLLSWVGIAKHLIQSKEEMQKGIMRRYGSFYLSAQFYCQE